jgi:hypothetical protein
MDELPPCGIYLTTRALGEIPAGRLVFFHNHGDPGPGVYLPAGWRANRAHFAERGHTLSSPEDAASLTPLAAEGLYVVSQPFFCCEKRCRRYERDELVQLGYNGAAEPILFTPELVASGVALPETGSRIDEQRIVHLRKLRVRDHRGPDESVELLLH